MTDEPLDKLASRLETMLPRIARRLFTLEVNQVAGELPAAQVRVCSHLLDAGECTISDIADELVVSPSAATQIVDRLEKTGLVERIADAADRRVKRARLTEQGITLMEARRSRRIERVRSALAKIAPQDRDEIMEALQCLLDASVQIGPAAVPEVQHTGPLTY